MDDTIITVDINESQETHINEEPTPPPPSPVITIRLFNTEFDQSIIKNDYELQDLLKIMDLYMFDISNVTLEPRFETLVNAIPDIHKIKIKLLYIIIANNWYRDLFEEKKKYPSVKVTQPVGVFRYNDYIIRIDDCPFSFMNESDVKKATIEIKEDNIIRPFLIYTNIRHNPLTNDICECRKPSCDCDYRDNAEYESPSCEIAQSCFQKLRTNTISFSISNGDIIVKDSTNNNFVLTNNRSTTIGIIANPFNYGYEYQTYGSWGNWGNVGAGSNAVSIGSFTPANNVPVIGKIPMTEPDWLSENGFWTYDESKLVELLGTYCVAWLEGVEINEDVKNKMKETLQPYEKEITKNNVLNIFDSFNSKRKDLINKGLEKLKTEEAV
jgi:hypothetical protein